MVGKLKFEEEHVLWQLERKRLKMFHGGITARSGLQATEGAQSANA